MPDDDDDRREAAEAMAEVFKPLWDARRRQQEQTEEVLARAMAEKHERDEWLNDPKGDDR